MGGKDLISVFEAINAAEAEMIRLALEKAGIKAVVEKTASPLDGLTSIGEGTEVMVTESDEDKALQVIEDYLSELDVADDDELGLDDDDMVDDDDGEDDDDDEEDDDEL